jgi:hypothetical protein
MANTYTYSGPATRWSEGDPTAVDYLNVSRVNSDHLYEALNTIIVSASITAGSATALKDGTTATTQGSSDNTTKLATTAYVTTAVAASSTSPGGSNTQIQYNNSGAFGGSANLAWTNGTSTLAVAGTANAKMLNISASGAALGSQNAFRIILVDLNDPATMWDVQAFLARARFTSWYQELGAPPMRGAMFITNAKTSLVWWNLDTDAQYIKFDTGGSSNDDSNMLYFSASSPPASLVFLDGKIFYGGTNGGGAWIIDFLRDESIGWFASGQRRYEGNIEERNDGKGNDSTYTSIQIPNGTVNDVAAARDTTLSDEFDRPYHWWSGGTAGGGCIYNPHNDSIYDWHDSSRQSTHQFLMNDKWLFQRNQTTYQGMNWIQMSGVTADQPTVITHFNPWNSADNSNNGSASFPWTVSATINGIAGNSDASHVFVASTEGLCRITFPTEDNIFGWTWATSAYQTPYMRGSTRIAAYPLNDVNDRSGSGHTLTNNNSTTFTSGVFGNTATFNGTNQYLSRTGDSGFNITGTAGDTFTVSFYYKSTSATNPGSNTYLMAIERAAGTESLEFYFTTAGKVVMYGYDGAGSGTITSAQDTYDAEWHHVVGAIAFGPRPGPWKGGTHDAYGWMRLWIDGVYAGGVNWGNTNSFGTDAIYIGTNEDATVFFPGQIAQLSFNHGTYYNAVWSENEIKAEYQRMVRGLGGATATLANTDVKSVQADPTGLAAVTTAANQTEIWDVETGLRESIDGTTTATIADADVGFKKGATLPEYITARSGAIEFDGQKRSVS